MSAVLIISKNKTVYVHLDRIIKLGRLIISDSTNEIILEKQIIESNYESVILNQDAGRYFIQISSECINSRKTITIK